MAQKKIKRLGLDPGVLSRFHKQQIHTVQDILIKSRLELIRLLGMSIFVIDSCIKKAADACAPKHITAYNILQQRNNSSSYLSTSLIELDKVLLGGIPAGTITEIAGPSGCGKTQFCIMLSVMAMQSSDSGGFDGNVLYIDTESAFSAERFMEMARSKYPDQLEEEDELMKLCSKLHVMIESSCASLLNRLQSIEEFLISKKISFIVVDSMASLVRKEFDVRRSKNMIERTNLLAKEAALLKYIAETFRIPIVVTNQITTKFGSNILAQNNTVKEEKELSKSFDGSDSGYVTAALGNTWSHSINTRLILQYLDGPRRQILVAKSPVAPFASFVYRITQSGLQLEDDGADCYEGTDPGLQKIRVRSDVPQSTWF